MCHCTERLNTATVNANFKPRVAMVTGSVESPLASGDLLKAKKECSLLTAAALGNPDSDAIARRDAACNEYHTLRGG